MADLKRKIVNDVLVYSSATYITQVLGIATSLSMRFFLDPAVMGAWSLLDLLLNYGLYSNLGILTALYTEMPYHSGRNEQDKAREIRDAGFSFTLTSSAAASFCFAVWAALSSASSEFRIGVAAIALILLSTSIYNFYVSLMWALKDFRSLSIGLVINASLYLAFVWIFVPKMQLMGLLAAVFLSISAAAVFMAIRTKSERPRFHLKRSSIAHLLKVGLPLVVFGFVYTFFMGLDRLIISRYLGLPALGHYSIALLVVAYANVMPKLLATVLFPNMQEQFGKSGSHNEISHFVTKPATALVYGLPFLLGGAYLVVPHLVYSLLPKYVPGLGSMRIFLLGTFFLSLCQPIQSYLTTIYKRWQALPIVGAGIVTAFGASLGFLNAGFGLSGVALGMSMGFFAYYTVLLFYVFRHFHSWGRTIAFYAESIACFAYFAATVLAISRFKPFASWTDVVPQLLLLAAACVPLVWIADRKTAAISTFWRAMKKQPAVELAMTKGRA